MYERPTVTRLGLLADLTSAKSGYGNDGNEKAVGMANDFDILGKSDD
ncbi:MAG: hypothetical protein O3A10_12060 [Chloroflexi bacterium]|nr:hypothetical protein [Chloroflexota bacterium]MDA1147109.1 hypothetical protein [Chloroflexota bacterium]